MGQYDFMIVWIKYFVIYNMLQNQLFIPFAWVYNNNRVLILQMKLLWKPDKWPAVWRENILCGILNFHPSNRVWLQGIVLIHVIEIF